MFLYLHLIRGSGVVYKGAVIGKKAQEIVNVNISCVSYSSTIIKSKICINNSNLIMNG